jgi:hypothetical protein
MIALVAVIGAVHPRPFISPDQGSIGSRIACLEERRSLVHGVDQMSLSKRPVWNRPVLVMHGLIAWKVPY